MLLMCACLRLHGALTSPVSPQICLFRLRRHCLTLCTSRDAVLPSASAEVLCYVLMCGSMAFLFRQRIFVAQSRQPSISEARQHSQLLLLTAGASAAVPVSLCEHSV